VNWNKDVIEKLYKSKIILKKGPDYPDGFLLKSGKRSDIYINIRDLIKNPSLFNFIMFNFFDLLGNEAKKAGSCILGVPTMGAVIAPIMAYKMCAPLVVIRQHKKAHGVGNNIEGTLTNKIIVVDDVITTGSSIQELAQEYIEPIFNKDYELDIFVIIDREQHGFKNVHSLATLSDIKKYRKGKEK
jgi:orotate phosphoribosyltransferase